MKSFGRHEVLHTEHRRCQHCHQVIVAVPEVGWVDPAKDHPYDMCPDQPMGIHDPEPL